MGVFESNEGSQNHLHESCSLARELQHIRIGDPSEQYNSRNSDQHAFFIEVVPQLVNYNISKFEIPRSSITPEIQIGMLSSLKLFLIVSFITYQKFRMN
ncbi:uncharacterized protein [Malus domestica]|uniref:uncharacterized protein isoform X4 n=1 Tax=Malus domestica TaxID=3750 RepID=UPI003974BD18